MNHFKSQKKSIKQNKTSEGLKEDNGPVLNIDFGDPYQMRNKSLEKSKHTIGASYGGLHATHHSANPQATNSSRPQT